LAFWPRRRNTPGEAGSAAAFFFFELALVLELRFAPRFPADFADEEEVSEAGSKAVAFSLRASQEYGDGEAGMIESQIIASEARVCVLALSEEE
jgi:hypothetical protein